MISYLSDKFAGEAYKVVDIDYQALAELRARKMYQCYETVVGWENFQFAVSTWLRNIQSISPCFMKLF